MKVTPAQLFALSVAAFAALVGLELFVSYRSNEEIRERFQNMNPQSLLNLRTKAIAEEMMQPVEAVEAADSEEYDDEGA